jgi:iron(III) transport system ATP-binding protein
VDTPFGTFAARHLSEGAPAAVCIRPEHLRVMDDQSGVVARVTRREFLGEIDQIELVVAGVDRPVMLRAFGRTRLAPGDSVFVAVNARDVLVVPRDET